MSRRLGVNATKVDLYYDIETARKFSLQEMQDYIISSLEVSAIYALLPSLFAGFENVKLKATKNNQKAVVPQY